MIELERVYSTTPKNKTFWQKVKYFFNRLFKKPDANICGIEADDKDIKRYFSGLTRHTSMEMKPSEMEIVE